MKKYIEWKRSAPFSKQYPVKQYLKHMKGRKPRVAKPEDLDVDNHQGVREAFRLIYQWAENRGVIK
jgi:hypothetical protein